MSIAHGPAQSPQHAYQWWEYRWTVLALVLAAAIPLLWPDVPPIVDLPGHMGRYRVQLDLASSPELQQYYLFHWALIGNLGVDLIVQALGPVFGIEPVVKMVAVCIPMLTVAGLLWVAREVHGRVPPTALFALPFAFNYPFLFGFINFALAMALALLAFALWLRLGRQKRWGLRIALFIPISCVIWICHAFGWGTLCLLAFSAELVRRYDQSGRLILSAWRTGLHCLALALPFALMLLWRSNAGGQTFDWFNWTAKIMWLQRALMDRWEWFDIVSLLLIIALLVWVLLSKRLTFSRNLGASALFMLAVYLILPRVVFGSAYADMRMAPYIFMVAIIAIRVPEGHLKLSRALAIAGLAFFGVRIAANTVSQYLFDARYDRELAALDHIPVGAPVVSFVGRPCQEPWGMSRLHHLPAMGTVRRLAFSNDQWTTAGAQLLEINYPQGREFVRDPYQIVSENACAGEAWYSINRSLSEFPRDAFDYVWLIDPPAYDARLTAGLTEVWRDGTSVLYRVDRGEPVPQP